ncbi:Secreted hypothetical protein, partial [Zostera marina]
MERRKRIYLGDILLLLIDLLVLVSHAVADHFFNNIEITCGGRRGEIMDRGGLLQLLPDKISKSGFQSKRTGIHVSMNRHIDQSYSWQLGWKSYRLN